VEGFGARPWKRAERAGVEIDVLVEERELVAKGLPVRHSSGIVAETSAGRRSVRVCLSAPREGYLVVYSPFVHVPAAHEAH
jgi:hypothetical protein